MSKYKAGDKVYSRTIPFSLTGQGVVKEEVYPGVYSVRWPHATEFYRGWEWEEDDLVKSDVDMAAEELGIE